MPTYGSYLMVYKKKAWVVTVNMGYGHKRAAYPLREIAHKRVIDVNIDPMMPEKERKTWTRIQHSYEWISRMKSFPLVGELVYWSFYRLQSISPLFPIRDLSKPTYGTRLNKKLIFKKDLCKDLAEEVSKTDLPVITTYPSIALSLAYRKVKNRIFCVVTDTDINRFWVADEPKKYDIFYLAPCKHVVMRLKEYGVPESNIILTGFPLPKGNIGDDSEILKKDIRKRLPNLDPKRRFIERNKPVLKKYLGGRIEKKSDHNLTICYLVGGAGAQKENGITIADSLRSKLKKNKLDLVLVAGSRRDVKSYFEARLKRIGLQDRIGKNIEILYNADKNEYFEDLNQRLRTVDVIWTKPSEMSFYAALGIPVIMTNPLGAHEGYNKEWLEHIGAGIKEKDVRYVDGWLDFMIDSGRLAHAAFDGFTEAMSRGTYNIEAVLSKRLGKTLFEK